MTSNIFPWCTFYNLEDLPDFPAIGDELAFAGKLARAYDQRLTFHPSHFVKVAAAEEQLLQRSLKELEVHSQVPPLLHACLQSDCPCSLLMAFSNLTKQLEVHSQVPALAFCSH